MFIGAIIGATAGSTKAKIVINGDYEYYDSNRNKLEGYSIKVLSSSHPKEPIQ